MTAAVTVDMDGFLGVTTWRESLLHVTGRNVVWTSPVMRMDEKASCKQRDHGDDDYETRHLSACLKSGARATTNLSDSFRRRQPAALALG